MSEPRIDLLFFRAPQQPPGSKELEGGSFRLSMKDDGRVVATATLVNGGVTVTKGRHSCWYPGPVILRARFEVAEGAFSEEPTNPASPQGKGKGK